MPLPLDSECCVSASEGPGPVDDYVVLRKKVLFAVSTGIAPVVSIGFAATELLLPVPCCSAAGGSRKT